MLQLGMAKRLQDIWLAKFVTISALLPAFQIMRPGGEISTVAEAQKKANN